MNSSASLSLLRDKRYVCALALAVAFTASAGAQLTVDSPAINNQIMSAPSFYVQAEATTCNSLTTASMAYSIDYGSVDGSDVVFSGAQALQQMVSPPSGFTNPITLHIKAWNTSGGLCEKSFPLTVGGGVTISSPGQGFTNPPSFQASASTCGGQPVSTMGYSVDTGNVTQISGTSLNEAVPSAANGWHILRVKAWGGSNYCESDLHYSVPPSGGLTPQAGAAQFDQLENDVSYPYIYPNGYQTCGGANNPTLRTWQTRPDCNTSGGASNSGSSAIVYTPTWGGSTSPAEASSRQFVLNYVQPGGGELNFDPLGPDDSATNFQYDVWVYFPAQADVTDLGNLELDTNHGITSPTEQVYIMSVQCNLDKGVWQIGSWTSTSATCTRSQFTPGEWHHIQIQVHHDADGGPNLYYDSVAVDGSVQSLTGCNGGACQGTVNASLKWGSVIGPNFQLDGSSASGAPSSGTVTVYADTYTIFYW